MTYRAVHAVFVLPAIAALALWLGPRRGSLPRRAGWAVPAIAVIALAWATPWDNYLVKHGIWVYGPDRVIGTIGYVPVEEYLFFLLQPVLTGLWFCAVLLGTGGASSAAASARAPALSRWVPAALWAALAGFGAWAFRHERLTYLALILVWAAPVLALLWAYAGAEVWRVRRAYLAGLAVPTLYLWVADAVAIRLGIWSIAPASSTGLAVAGLPVEEAIFFLVTNLLVILGLVALLYPPFEARARLAAPAPAAR